MDDLDALLADLQSTTAHINARQYETSPVHTESRQNFQADRNSGGSTPPPLPPPPQDVLENFSQDSFHEKQRYDVDSFHEIDGPIYEPQQLHAEIHVRERTPSSDASSRGSDILPPEKPPPPKPGMSQLSNNLSELDQLMQDLDSAQFLNEIDRKSSGPPRPSTNGVSKQPPPTAPKPSRQGQERTSVDYLLDDLESAVPSPGYNSQGGPNGPASQKPHEHHTTTQTIDGQTIQASSATQDLDELMGSLSHFQISGQGQNHQQDMHLQSGGDPGYSQGFNHDMRVQSGREPAYNQGHNPHQDMRAQSGGDPAYNQAYNHHQETRAQSGGDPTYNQVYNHPQDTRTQSGGDPAYAKPVKGRGIEQRPPPPADQSQPSLPQPAIQSAPGDHLDSMLGDLRTDMNKQGVTTKTKGVCAACDKPVAGQFMTALGKIWHVEHFTCHKCKEPLGTKNFFERDGAAYCENDYHHLFAPRCAYCNGPIVDKCITALNKTWHTEHFFCATCGSNFGDEGYHEKDGHAYCREDYFNLFAPKCGGCQNPIMNNYINALNRQWHPECFVCWDCRTPFGTGSFFDHDGLPYCETHYHAKRGSLCAGCQKPITGRCITAMFRKFHPEHFTCAFCLKQLNKGTFKEQNDKPYCHPCFVKLFG